MSILITGGSGMLGKALRKDFPEAEYLNGTADLNLLNHPKVLEWFKGKYYSTIIHCAGFTDLAYCNNNPKNTENLHSRIVSILNDYCDKLIYISTNLTSSKNVYYYTKRAGEKNTLSRNTNLVVRTNIYGNGGLAKWAYNEIKSGNKINGYINSMFNAIHVSQLSRCIKHTLMDSSGIISVAGDYILSKYDFIHYIANLTGLNSKFINKHYLKYEESNIISCPEYKFNLTDGMYILKEELQNG